MKSATLEFNGEQFKRFYITEQEDFLKACRLIVDSRAPRFGLDIETSKKPKWIDFVPVKRGNRIIGPCPGLCPLLSDIRLTQIYDPIRKAVFVFDWMHLGSHYIKGSGLFRIMMQEKKFIAHNGLFEIKHFTNAGYPDLKIDCSMLLNILIDRAEKSPFEPEEEDDDEPADGLAKYKKTGFSLDAVTDRLFGVRISKFFQTSNWNLAELDKQQLNYAALDAVLTYKIGMHEMKKVKDYNMKRAYSVLRDMQHVVADMELKGVAIDQAAHKDLINLWKVQHEQYTAECRSRFNKLNVRSSKQLNVRSSKQLNEWAQEKYPEKFLEKLWPRTAASSPEKRILSFGKSSLIEVIDTIQRKYKKESKALTALLEYKKVDKLLSTYGETLERIIHPITGRIHCSFVIGETRTGRLSSREPNLQNLPRDENVRKLFIAPDDKQLLVADYSQIEIRSGAALSHDPVMTNAFIRGIDLHKYILKMAFGWRMKDITKEQRQLGKAINFGYMFGMGPNKFEKYALTSYGERVTDKQAGDSFETYHKLYSGYSNWCTKERYKCARLGWVRTPLGKMRKLLPEEQYTRAVNTQVQGGAAEAIMIALTLYRQQKLKDYPLVSTIHDEIIIECQRQNEEVSKILEDCMIKGFQAVFPEAPINNLVEAKFGRNWSEAK